MKIAHSVCFRSRRTLGAWLVAAAVSSAVFAAAPATAAPDALGTAMKSVLESQINSVVTVKFVMKYEGFGQDGEVESDIPGLMIESSGLVICSNLRTGGMAAMMGGRGGSMTPHDIKVLIGDDSEGIEAKIIARDSELDLAWIKIDEAKAPKDGKGFVFVDFSKSANAEVGDSIFTIARLGKFFDRAPYAHDSRILGHIKKPRKLLHLKTEDYGAPAFNSSGEPIGIVIFQTPNREDMEGGGENQDRGGLVILPGSEIGPATVKAKEAAASGKPVDPPAPPKTEETEPKAPQGEPPAAPEPAPK